MEAFLVSTGVVALGEIGDKTQLLALMLTARFRKPWPIVLGILGATLVNHLGAGAAGAWLTRLISPDGMRWLLAASFIGMAAWMLIPDQADEEALERTGRLGIFATTLVTFFLAEMGDKTQIATIALAAKYQTLLPVVAGTTLGMLIADVPVIFLGDRLTRRLPTKAIHALCAFIFAALGVAALLAG